MRESAEDVVSVAAKISTLNEWIHDSSAFLLKTNLVGVHHLRKHFLFAQSTFVGCRCISLHLDGR